MPQTDDAFSFQVLARDGAARQGTVSTPRGAIRTPAFMPVGTAATVKAMYPGEVRALGADVLLCNTYHLMLAPTAERIAGLGGLHKFMNWPLPILTDSGGFQVMSLAKLRKLDERGVVFQSHIDGSRHELTPERSMEIQRLLGSDIQMQFDECIRLPASREETERAMRLSLRWAARSRDAFGAQPGRAIFGIVQGGADKALRVESARELAAMDFHGYSIGGLAVGEPQAIMLDMIETVEPAPAPGQAALPHGRGHARRSPEEPLARRGYVRLRHADPGRPARHGLHAPRTDEPSQRPLGRRPAPDRRSLLGAGGAGLFARLLRHLVKSGEILAMMALTAVNLAYYQDLMAGARAAIAAGRLQDYVAEVEAGWAAGENGRA